MPHAAGGVDAQFVGIEHDTSPERTIAHFGVPEPEYGGRVPQERVPQAVGQGSMGDARPCREERRDAGYGVRIRFRESAPRPADRRTGNLRPAEEIGTHPAVHQPVPRQPSVPCSSVFPASVTAERPSA